MQLDRREKQNLKLWINSPFANARKDVIALFDFIYSKRAVNEKNIDKHAAFTSIYPGQPYNEQQLRYVMSFATNCMEDFLAYDHWKKNQVQHKLSLIKNINHKNLNSFTQQHIKDTVESLHSQPHRNNDYYLQSYQLETEFYTLQSKNKRYEDFNLQAVSNHFHNYAIAEILKYACTAVSYEQVSGKTFEFALLHQCLELIESKPSYRDIPPINIYYLCYKISTSGSDLIFRELYKVIFEYETFFNEQELKDIFLLTINYCIKELNVGKQDYAEYAYQLYLYALNKGYLLDNGELSRFTFKNIVFIGVKKLKQYKSVENFIDTFQNNVNAEYRESTVLFNRAVLYTARKEYKKAMKILQQVEFADVLWNLDAKSMLLKIYFEEKEFEALLHLSKSFRLYIHRQKNLGIYKLRYKQMISFCEKLYKHTGASKNKKRLLRNAIDQNSNLPEKEWFLEQVDNL